MDSMKEKFLLGLKKISKVSKNYADKRECEQ
jgi:hypothetical protein